MFCGKRITISACWKIRRRGKRLVSSGLVTYILIVQKRLFASSNPYGWDSSSRFLFFRAIRGFASEIFISNKYKIPELCIPFLHTVDNRYKIVITVSVAFLNFSERHFVLYNFFGFGKIEISSVKIFGFLQPFHLLKTVISTRRF